LDKHSCKQDLSLTPTWLTEQGPNAHVYTIRNTADHYNFSLAEQKENKLNRKLHGDEQHSVILKTKTSCKSHNVSSNFNVTCKKCEHCHQEGGGVSKVNIGSVTTASVTSRFTWMKFKMAPNG